jgi:hypothetical protein
MTKETKRKLLFITIILASLMLLSSAYASSIPSVYAEESDFQDQTLRVLRDVVGLETELYTTSLSSQHDSQYIILPQKETDIQLASGQGKLRVSCTFVNDILRKIYLSDCEGELLVKQPTTNTAEMAIGFLARYQNYAGDSLYSKLASMLDYSDANINITRSAGNVKLEVFKLGPKTCRLRVDLYR